MSARTSAEYVVVPIEPSEVERVFREAGALRDGHFILSSGKHSPRYLEKFQVLQHPRDTERLAAAIAEWARTSEVETVAGPTTGGIILAHEVARQLGARAIYAERREARSGREFRRGFTLRRGERVLVVDDILTTGGSVLETIDAVREGGGAVIGVAVLVDRSDEFAPGIPMLALWRLEVPTYPPSECPLCASGIRATHPGTSPAPAAAAR